MHPKTEARYTGYREREGENSRNALVCVCKRLIVSPPSPCGYARRRTHSSSRCAARSVHRIPFGICGISYWLLWFVVIAGIV
jgi:hypothetical protein